VSSIRSPEALELFNVQCHLLTEGCRVVVSSVPTRLLPNSLTTNGRFLDLLVGVQAKKGLTAR
jgi:hypothetical protein